MAGGMVVLGFRCVGFLYLLSGLWCAVKPQLAAGFLGLQFSHDAGLAEFFSVYGGLQVGMAMAILASSFIPNYRLAASFFALVISLGLFSFRLLSVCFIDQSPELIVMLCLEGFIVLLLMFIWRTQVGIGREHKA
jgi:hypothetical protein